MLGSVHHVCRWIASCAKAQVLRRHLIKWRHKKRRGERGKPQGRRTSPNNPAPYGARLAWKTKRKLRMWICRQCGEPHQDDFKLCWKCVGQEMREVPELHHALPPGLDRKLRPISWVIVRAAIAVIV